MAARPSIPGRAIPIDGSQVYERRFIDAKLQGSAGRQLREDVKLFGIHQTGMTELHLSAEPYLSEPSNQQRHDVRTGSISDRAQVTVETSEIEIN